MPGAMRSSRWSALPARMISMRPILRRRPTSHRTSGAVETAGPRTSNGRLNGDRQVCAPTAASQRRRGMAKHLLTPGRSTSALRHRPRCAISCSPNSTLLAARRRSSPLGAPRLPETRTALTAADAQRVEEAFRSKAGELWQPATEEQRAQPKRSTTRLGRGPARSRCAERNGRPVQRRSTRARSPCRSRGGSATATMSDSSPSSRA